MKFLYYFSPFYRGKSLATYYHENESPGLLMKAIMRMHIIFFLILITCLNVFSKETAAQISLHIERGDLETIFKAIEKQTDYSFMYEVSLLKESKVVSIDVKGAELKEVLDEVFRGQPFYYEVISKTIVVKERVRSGLGGVQEEIITIRGKITDRQNIPLVGVSVRIKGTSIGTLTDQNGNYTITADPNGVIIFSYVGYQTFNIMINGQTEINMTMVEATAQLKEVTVQTGYQTISPERFVGSAVVVDSTILERQIGRDLLTRLDGTTSGLLFNKSGGAGVLQVQLRGISTLNSANDLNGISSQNPLIILDDFPYTGDIKSINPNTIESISILKDAVATSIWGARAGNGVIVIKSKKGKLNERVSVTFNSNLSVAEKPDVHYFPQMSSSDFIDVELDLFSKGFYDLHIQYPQFFSTSPVVDFLAKKRSGDITESEAKTKIDALRFQDVRNDINRYVFRNAFYRQNFLNVSGGANAIGYNFSFGADNNSTSVQGPGQNNRYTFNSRIQFTPIKQLEFLVGIDYNHEQQMLDGISYPLSTGGKYILPYAGLADENGIHLAVPTSFGHSFLESLPYDKLLDWQFRPLDERDLIDYRNTINLLRMNFGSKIKITTWLSGDLKYQYTRQTFDNRNLRDENTYFTRDLINQFTDPSTYVKNISNGGILDLRTNELSTHNIRGQLNVYRNWRSVHDFSALIAGEISQSRLYGSYQRLYGFNNEVANFSQNINYATSMNKFLGGRGRIPNPSGIEEKNNNLVSILANASYTYDSRYGLYASARRDG